MKTSATQAWVLIVLSGCASAPVRTQSAGVRANTTVRGGEFHVVASAGGGGDAYDAAMLFERGNTLIRAGHCDQAVAEFERLEREFPRSVSVEPSRFNRGVCLQSLARWDGAAEAIERIATDARDASLVRDARFHLAAVGEQSRRWRWTLDATAAVLASNPQSSADRAEALGRRAVALFETHDRAGARDAANQAVAIAPDAAGVTAIGDDTWIARSRYVIAEISRTEAEEIAIRADRATVESEITDRVTRTVHAHAQFNETIRVGNPEWAAAAGFRIGEMYRDLYRAIVEAPLPAEWGERARAAWHRRTSELLRPLLSGAIRSWEATMSMAQRNGITANEWVHRADDALRELRRAFIEPG
jgi:tetratricopeptide (TPR) repeat protein